MPGGGRFRDTNEWKGLKGVRAGRVGGTDRAPNHINLSQGKAEYVASCSVLIPIASRNPHHPVESSSRFKKRKRGISRGLCSTCKTREFHRIKAWYREDGAGEQPRMVPLSPGSTIRLRCSLTAISVANSA